MDSITECKIPLLWNANGFVEIIQHDDISYEEAEKIIRLLKGHMDPEKDYKFRPSSRSSNDVSSESDSQEKSSTDSLDEEDIYKRLIAPKSSRNPFHKDRSIQISPTNDNDEKVHVCDTCGKRFSRKFNLNTHIKCVHTQEKDYVCGFCQRAFNHSSNLRKHIKTVHGSEKRLPCPLCEKPFKHPVALKNHVKIIHGKELDRL